ncbi:MAG: anaerobic glycerol-3-phosphate dehydrogenase subunit A [Deltaproteobacteria bacterium]|nr:anaerobic glycerol-3-phosphate dehydrogenase subunit A [Deltaproteobacteria bacterium]
MKTQVLIIGGGITGTGLARDLALRGVECILVDKRDINAGASGGNHGLLHSGGRYVATDPVAARECHEEGELLKHLAPQCIEDTGGLFIAVEGDDEKYIADFPSLCAQCGIPIQPMDPEQAREIEPALSEKVIAAYSVQDAAVDPFMLSLENLSHAQELGVKWLSHTKVRGFEIRNSRIRSVRLEYTQTAEEVAIEADIVVNAAGAWAGLVAGLAGIPIHILYSKGTLLITQSRITRRVINRLRPASDADIVVPGGVVSIVGTTSIRIDDPDDAYPTIKEVDLIIDDAKVMIPALDKTRYVRAYCGVRPLFGSAEGDGDRSVSRGFTVMDHGGQGINNFITITGGKLTTYRLMAEKTADLVCQHLGVSKPCLTRTKPLPASHHDRWTEPALAPKVWLKDHGRDDVILCECEMVPKSVVDSIIDSIHQYGGKADLHSIGLRSRIGKGPCQGTFCGPRVMSYLFDRGELSADQCLQSLRDFARGRWKGLHSILWDQQLKQVELLEAMECGMLGLELKEE